jgi:hypothetical protein
LLPDRHLGRHHRPIRHGTCGTTDGIADGASGRTDRAAAVAATGAASLITRTLTARALGAIEP